MRHIPKLKPNLGSAAHESRLQNREFDCMKIWKGAIVSVSLGLLIFLLGTKTFSKETFQTLYFPVAVFLCASLSALIAPQKAYIHVLGVLVAPSAFLTFS